MQADERFGGESRDTRPAFGGTRRRSQPIMSDHLTGRSSLVTVAPCSARRSRTVDRLRVQKSHLSSFVTVMTTPSIKGPTIGSAETWAGSATVSRKNLLKGPRPDNVSQPEPMVKTARGQLACSLLPPFVGPLAPPTKRLTSCWVLWVTPKRMPLARKCAARWRPVPAIGDGWLLLVRNRPLQ